MLAAIAVQLAGCGDSPPPPAAPRPPPERMASAPANPQAVAPETAIDPAVFDRIVTPESVFSESATRARYRAMPASTANGQRSHAFELIAQPGMDEKRHFGLVTVTWARGGTFVKAGAAPPSGVGGPGGGFVDAFAQTADGAFDVRVTQGMLLPAGVELPPFDVQKAAAEMARLHQVQR